MIIAKFCLVIVAAYLLGSIPFGQIVGWLFTRGDITQFGSGRTGATNVLRTAGKRAALLVGLLDISKGILAVCLAKSFVGDGVVMMAFYPAGVVLAGILASYAVVLGHIFPVFNKFRGGPGGFHLFRQCPGGISAGGYRRGGGLYFDGRYLPLRLAEFDTGRHRRFSADAGNVFCDRITGRVFVLHGHRGQLDNLAASG